MGRCHFQVEWLQKTDDLGYKISSWLKRDTDTSAFCQICCKSLNITKGFQAVSQHVGCVKHAENARVKLAPQQLRFVSLTADPRPSGIFQETGKGDSINSGKSQNKTVNLYSSRDSATRAELIWSMKNVTSNMSALSCEGIVNIFEAMFPGGTPDGMSLGATKLSYLITEALSPYFRKQMLIDAKNAYYTLIFDETTNCEGKKELQTMLRYWSDNAGEIVVHHLETMFMGHATAENLKENLMKSLDNANLPLERLLMLSSDGPNVNKKVWRLVNEELKLNANTRSNGLLDLGTCNIHILHNAFLKGLEALGVDASDLVLSIYYFFDGWPARREDYQNIQKLEGVPSHCFIKHVPSRWLTLLDSAKRVLEQWQALKKYFLIYIPQKQPNVMKNGKTYHTIAKALQCPTMRAELEFVVSVASVFSLHTGTFQRQEPLIHVLYDTLKLVLLTLMGRFMKHSVLSKLKKFSLNILDEYDNFLPLEQIQCGIGKGTEELNENGVSEKERKFFKTNARKNYVAACKHILQKSCLGRSSSQDLMKYFRCLQPEERNKPRSSNDIAKISAALPFQVRVDVLCDEWKLLQTETDVPSFEHLRVDHYWKSIFERKGCSGNPKYPTVTQIIKAFLSLAHGSADVEREFSRSARVLTDEKASMSLKVLNARLTVADGLKRFNNKPELVPITQELLCLAQRAHKSYINHLENERQKKEEIETKKQEKERELAEEQAKLQEFENTNLHVKHLEENLKKCKKAQEEKQVVFDKLFEEGNKKLKVALQKKDFVQIELAQAMLESAKIKIDEAKAQASHTESLQTFIQKRKSNLITKFLLKKPKAK